MSSKHGRFFALCATACLVTTSFWGSPIAAQASEKYLNPVPIPIPATPLYVSAAEETRMISDVNAARIAAGLSPLAPDTRLASLARSFAQDMASRRYFGHLTPEGRSMGDRLQSAGIDYQYAGENIAFVQSETEAMQGFLHSEGHRENILNKRYTRIGVGIIIAEGYGAIFVQEFSGG